MICIYSHLVSKFSELANCFACRHHMFLDLPQKGNMRAIEEKMVEYMNVANLRIVFDDGKRP
jgi:hypothetical protein